MPQKTSLPTVQPQPYGNAKPGNRTMPNNAASFLLRYSCAAVSIALATWVRRLLDPALGLQFPYATIYFPGALCLPTAISVMIAWASASTTWKSSGKAVADQPRLHFRGTDGRKDER